MTITAHPGKTLEIRGADGRAEMPDSRKSLGRRLGLRLWTLVHAQALLNGTADSVRYGPR